MATIIPLATLEMVGRKRAKDRDPIEAGNRETALEDGVESSGVGIGKPDLLVASRPSITYMAPYRFASFEKEAPLKPPLAYVQTRHRFTKMEILFAHILMELNLYAFTKPCLGLSMHRKPYSRVMAYFQFELSVSEVTLSEINAFITCIC